MLTEQKFIESRYATYFHKVSAKTLLLDIEVTHKLLKQEEVLTSDKTSIYKLLCKISSGKCKRCEHMALDITSLFSFVLQYLFHIKFSFYK